MSLLSAETTEPVAANPVAGAEPMPTVDNALLPNSVVSVIAPPAGWASLNLAELWRYRDLLTLLVWRDMSARYRQSVIGYGWAWLKPILMTVIFTIAFGGFLNIDTGEVPYSVFTLTGQIPWMYFSGALATVTASVVSSGHMLTKVYFPRLILPLAGIVTGLFELAIQLVLVAVLMAWYRIIPGWPLLALPFFVLMSMVAALAVGLWLTALNVKYRDIGMALPFLIQLWMFVCPVIYPLTNVPERYREWYCLNPMVGVIEGFRWSLLGTTELNVTSFGVSCCVTFLLLVGGLFYFRKTETTFADVI